MVDIIIRRADEVQQTECLIKIAFSACYLIIAYRDKKKDGRENIIIIFGEFDEL